MKDSSGIRIEFAGEDPVIQNKAVRLLGRCFPEYWEQRARQEGRFPFRELSFAALDAGNEVLGHVGIMPFEVMAPEDGRLQLAGIASVAVAPECRGRGLAASLCRAAAAWAEKNSFVALPLYTSLTHVYASTGWSDYPSGNSCSLIPPQAAQAGLPLRSGQELSAAEKNAVMEFYESAPQFPGKVIRGTGRNFHDWPRIFRDTDIRLIVSDRGYALFYDGALAEVCGRPGCAAELLAGYAGELPAALASEDAVIRGLLEKGWRLRPGDRPDVRHGEHVMIRNAAGAFPRNMGFPLADKF